MHEKKDIYVSVICFHNYLARLNTTQWWFRWQKMAPDWLWGGQVHLNLDLTQFEIERRSYGQSMTYFRLFSCGGQTYFSGCHSFFRCLVRNLQKNVQNVQNQSSCGSALGTSLTDWRLDMWDFLTDFWRLSWSI